MDALLPALIAALLAHTGDRPPWMAARLADHGAGLSAIVAAIVLTQAISQGVAAAGAMLVAPSMTPNARQFLAGVALCWAAVASAMPPRAPRAAASGRGGAFVVAVAALIATTLGDRTQFATFGLASAGMSPMLSAAGAAIGATTVSIAAAAMGETAWRGLPHLALRMVAGTLLAVAGVVMLLSALRLW
jgi:putative Ca2+/H+ antiporter (TMEM165/GDT1 family)